MTPCFSYLRVSGASQIDGDGFPRQRLAIEQYAAQHGYEIREEFLENGVTGKCEAELRPAWGRMLKQMLADRVGVVIVERVDRVARQLMIQELAVADCQRKGLTIISTAEPDLCSDDPTRILVRQILGAFAEYERSMIVAKLRDARERTKAARGKCEGNKGYGFYPAEKPALAEILRHRDSGRSAVRIAAELNAAGVPSRKGGAWSPRVVSRILAANGRRAA